MIKKIIIFFSILLPIFFVTPQISHGAWQDKVIDFYSQNSVSTNNDGSFLFKYPCVIGDTLKDFSFNTRTVGGSRPFALMLDGVQIGATTTNTVTPGYLAWNNINKACLDGDFDIRFNQLGSTFYAYGVLTSIAGALSPYNLVHKRGGPADYYTQHRATWTLPITIATSSDMGTTTIGTSPVTDSALFLLGIIASALIFLLLVRIIWKP